MTISTPRIDRRHAAALARSGRSRGFSLVEVMVAATLSTLILGGVLSAFLFIGRTGFSSSAYSEMEAQVRRGLDTFANDARMASDIHWNSSQSITFTLPTSTSASTQVTYAYDSSTAGDTAECFYRVVGGAGSTAPRRVLVREVNPDFSFARYKLEQNGVTDNTAINDLETKLIQINLHVARAAVTVGTTSQTSRSARYLLRNKRVTN